MPICKVIIPLTTIAGIIGIEIYALSLGINGTALSASIGALGGIGGYYLKKRKQRNVES